MTWVHPKLFIQPFRFGNESVFCPPAIKIDVCGGRHNHGEFAPQQAENASQRGYLSARLMDGSPLRVSRVEKQKGAVSRIDISEKSLPGGAKIIVVIGDTSTSRLGTTTPTTRMLNKFISLSCPEPSPATASKLRKADPNTNNSMVAACVMNIVGGELKHLRAYVPSQYQPGKQRSAGAVRGPVQQPVVAGSKGRGRLSGPGQA